MRRQDTLYKAFVAKEQMLAKMRTQIKLAANPYEQASKILGISALDIENLTKLAEKAKILSYDWVGLLNMMLQELIDNK